MVNSVFLIAAAVMLILYLYEHLTGKSVLPYVSKGQPVMDALTMLAKAVSGVTGSQKFETAFIIIKAATEAARKAEDLAKLGDLEKDKRHEYAFHMIEATLNEAGVAMTDNISMLINGALVLAAMLLPPFKEVNE